MTPTRKCETRPPCCRAGDVKSAILQRSARQSHAPLASRELGVALGLLDMLMAEVLSMPGCVAACGVEAFLPHVQACRVTRSYGPSLRRQLCQSQSIQWCQDKRGIEVGTAPSASMLRRTSAFVAFRLLWRHLPRPVSSKMLILCKSAIADCDHLS